MDLNNKIAVITGVSKGIGQATALQLLAQGCRVFGLGRNNTITHPNFTFITCDIRNPKQVEEAFNTIYNYTQNQIHILINNQINNV